ncbi:hypothetical protein Tco_0266678 [Tanacetum coccineum]
METVKFKAPPLTLGPAESRNKNFLEFHRDKGHGMDECIHLLKQIEEAVKSGQLSHLIKELKQGDSKGEHARTAKKGETFNKEKATEIFMVQPWQQENPIVIETEFEGHLIHRMYVNGGSALEILYEYCFNRLRLEVKSRMTPATTPLLRFSGKISWPLGQISLMVSLGDGEHSMNALMNFMVVRSPSPYNANGGGRDKSSNSSQIPKTNYHNRWKPIRERKDGTLLFAQEQLRHIRLEASRHDRRSEIHNRASLEYPRRVPAYNTEEKRTCTRPDRNKAIQQEVAKLVEAQIMREVHYHNWLSNPVMVKKHNDAYKGYHQIQMAEEDEEKTAFHPSQGNYMSNLVDDVLLRKCLYIRDCGRLRNMYLSFHHEFISMEHEHEVLNLDSTGTRLQHRHLYLKINVSDKQQIQFKRISLTGFPAQSVRSSNAIALDSLYLLVLITGASQSRQHVDTSLIHIESRKPPTKSLFDVDSSRISIVIVNTKEHHSDVLAVSQG